MNLIDCKCGRCHQIILSKDVRGRSRRFTAGHQPRTHWKGGRIVRKGYVLLHLPWHPSADTKGYKFEHRYIMEKHLGRFLNSNEIVHHINGNTQDNRIENLSLFTRATHMSLHRKQQIA